MLRLSTRAPAFMHSTIAPASSLGVALGIAPFCAALSLKMGRINSVHPGQIAGAGEALLALKIPAVKVPWMQAALLEWVHPEPGRPPIPLTLSDARSGWFMATGPSIKPITI